MKCVIDTSAYSAFNRGDQRLRQWFRANNDIVVPLIVVGELRAGFAAGSKRQANDRLLQRFLDAPNVHPVTISDKTTQLFAEIYHTLRKLGKPIGTNDMWIAALALEQDQPLLTLDTDFAQVPDLMLASL